MLKRSVSYGLIYYWLLVIILYLPIVLLVIFSFNDSETLRFPLEAFTLRWYQELSDANELIEALKNSLWVGLLSSIASTVIGLMAAIAIIRFDFPGRRLFIAASSLPLVIPAVVIGVAMLLLFRQTFDVELSLWTVGVAHTVVNVPVVMLIVGARLAGFPDNLEEAAMDLGASYWGAQMRVVLPLSLPALLAAFLTSFTTSFDEYAMSVFIVGTDSTLPVYMYSLLRFPRKLPLVVALGGLIMAASVIVILISEWLRRAGSPKYSNKRIGRIE